MTAREITTAQTYELQQRLGALRNMDFRGIRSDRLTAEVFAIDDELDRRAKACR
jgi:hypothetical protein